MLYFIRQKNREHNSSPRLAADEEWVPARLDSTPTYGLSLVLTWRKIGSEHNCERFSLRSVYCESIYPILPCTCHNISKQRVTLLHVSPTKCCSHQTWQVFRFRRVEWKMRIAECGVWKMWLHIFHTPQFPYSHFPYSSFSIFSFSILRTPHSSFSIQPFRTDITGIVLTRRD